MFGFCRQKNKLYKCEEINSETESMVNTFGIVAEAISLNASLTQSYQRIKCAERDFAPCLGSECNRIATFKGDVVCIKVFNGLR